MHAYGASHPLNAHHHLSRAQTVECTQALDSWLACVHAVAVGAMQCLPGDLQAKLRRIRSIMAHRHMSQQGLVAMLGPEECTRAEVRAAVDDFSSDVIDTVDIPTKARGSWTWHIAKFQRLLPCVVSRCAGFRVELESAFTHFPNSQSSPWRLVLYSDEITPGNVLKLQNRRKAACWYLGVVEMMGFAPQGGRLVDHWCHQSKRGG